MECQQKVVLDTAAAGLGAGDEHGSGCGSFQDRDREVAPYGKAAGDRDRPHDSGSRAGRHNLKEKPGEH